MAMQMPEARSGSPNEEGTLGLSGLLRRPVLSSGFPTLLHFVVQLSVLRPLHRERTNFERGIAVELRWMCKFLTSSVVRSRLPIFNIDRQQGADELNRNPQPLHCQLLVHSCFQWTVSAAYRVIANCTGAAEAKLTPNLPKRPPLLNRFSVQQTRPRR